MRPEWSSFVARCVRSWVTARASASEFLATWTPLSLPPPRCAPVRPERSRRKPSSAARRTSHRAAHYPTDPAAVNWHVALAAPGSGETLSARYPLVSALLVELAARSGRRPAAPPTQRRV